MRYLIFPYTHDGQQYVEAYPTTDPALLAQFLPTDIVWASYDAPSRNQARRKAYEVWIDATGKGFNALPYRPYAQGPKHDRLNGLRPEDR
jgi:hypothetical protein